MHCICPRCGDPALIYLRAHGQLVCRECAG